MCGSEHSFEEKNLVDICGAVGCIESGDSCGAVDCIGKNSLEVLTDCRNSPEVWDWKK